MTGIKKVEIQNGDLVRIINTDELAGDERNVVAFTEGKIYRVKNFMMGFKVVNDLGGDFYVSSNEVVNNLVKVSDEELKTIVLEERVASLEENSKMQTAIIGRLTDITTHLVEKLEGTEALDGLDGLDGLEEKDEQALNYSGAYFTIGEDKYIKVDRLAQKGDYIVYPKINSYWDDIVANTPYYVYDEPNGTPRFRDERYDSIQVYGSDEEDKKGNVLVYQLFEEPVELEDEVSEGTLEEITPDTIREGKILEAKKFLEDNKTTMRGIIYNDSPLYSKGSFEEIEDVYSVTLGVLDRCACKVEFITLEQKGRVIALLRGVGTNKVYARGVSTCYYGDVFNEDIGKAVALAKALKLDYSQFIDIPNPMGMEVGSVVKIKEIDREYTIARFEGQDRVRLEGEFAPWEFINNIEKVIE